MSHAEAFGHFRSFVVGTEKNARTLRLVLEDTGNANGKWSNGKFGISSQCARALESASPEVTTKELIAEVAEQETILRGVEATMRTERPIAQVIDKYEAIVEYNELAFVDLEERLSAYGYVRPPAVGAAASSVTDRPPSRAAARALPAKADVVSARGGDGDNIGDRRGGDGVGGAAGDADPAEGDAASRNGPKQDTSCRPQGGELELDDAVSADAGVDGPGPLPPGRGDAEAVPASENAADGVAAPGTPVRSTATAAAAAVVAPEDDADSPATPTLAEWEISEETREMLRQDQLQRQRQLQLEQQGDGDGIGSVVAASVAAVASSTTATRSLDVLLAEASTVASRGGPRDGGKVGVARSSVSSSWSPPHLNTPSFGGRGGGREFNGVGGGSGGGGGDGSPAAGVHEGVGGGVALTSASPWRSDPPTPRMPSLEGGGRWTPDRHASGGRRRDRDSSVETPKPDFSSPMKTAMGRSLMEAAMSCGKREEGDGTAQLSGEMSCSLNASYGPTPGGRAFTQGGEPSLGDNMSTGPQDEFWGEDSPASPVSPSRDTTGEVSPDRAVAGPCAASSPETPRTPPMPSPRHLDDDTEQGGGTMSAAGPRSSGRSARSIEGTAWTPTGVSRDRPAGSSYDGSGRSRSSRGSRSGRGSGSDGSGDRSNGGYRQLYNSGGDGNGEGEDNDDDEWQTPELSSPPRAELFVEESQKAPALEPVGAALFRRRLEEAEGAPNEAGNGAGGPGLRLGLGAAAGTPAVDDGPLALVSEEEYARAPTFLTIQVSRSILNEAIRNLNAYAAPRLASPSELLLTVDEITAIIDQGELSRTLLLSAAHLKRVEMKGSRMYRLRCNAG